MQDISRLTLDEIRSAARDNLVLMEEEATSKPLLIQAIVTRAPPQLVTHIRKLGKTRPHHASHPIPTLSQTPLSHPSISHACPVMPTLEDSQAEDIMRRTMSEMINTVNDVIVLSHRERRTKAYLVAAILERAPPHIIMQLLQKATELARKQTHPVDDDQPRLHCRFEDTEHDTSKFLSLVRTAS